MEPSLESILSRIAELLSFSLYTTASAQANPYAEADHGSSDSYCQPRIDLDHNLTLLTLFRAMKIELNPLHSFLCDMHLSSELAPPTSSRS